MMIPILKTSRIVAVLGIMCNWTLWYVDSDGFRYTHLFQLGITHGTDDVFKGFQLTVLWICVTLGLAKRQKEA